MQAVLRRQAVGLYAELLQRVREWKRQIYIGEGVVVICPVHDIVISGGRSAADRNSRGIGVVLRRDDRVVSTKARAGDGHGAARQKNQLRGLASVQGQIDDAALV